MFKAIFILLVIVLSILILFLSSNNIKKKPSFFIVWVVVLGLCVICSMRDESIRDTSGYIDTFLYGDERTEAGFQFLVRFIKRIWNYVPFIFCVIALISVGFKILYFKKYAFYFWPTVLIYISSTFISEDFIAIRAALVTSLVLWLIILAKEKRLLLFLLTVALAFSFHVTALTCLLIWPLVNWEKVGIKAYIWFIPISYVIYLTGHGFGYLASYLGIPYIQGMYALYTGETGEELTAVNAFSVTQMIRCCACMVILWVNRNRELGWLYLAFLKMYCFGICLYVLLTDVPAFSARISGLFAIAGVMVLGNLFYYLPNIKVEMVKWIIVVFAIINLISSFQNVL